ncbi:helix-turn-helix domain-containing protein [Microbacterium oleivorans]|uniref:helix-turn-helix domain-containing protein n=1 Tax=Microbacterium TaxID=33882 RepID=UPI0034044DD3
MIAAFVGRWAWGRWNPLELVHDALRRLGGGTAADLAAELGLSRVSCRRYLEHLADEGAARRTMDYATAGRPSTRYVV